VSDDLEAERRCEEALNGAGRQRVDAKKEVASWLLPEGLMGYRKKQIGHKHKTGMKDWCCIQRRGKVRVVKKVSRGLASNAVASRHPTKKNSRGHSQSREKARLIWSFHLKLYLG